MAEVLETSRLILRGWTNEDVEPWVAMNGDPRVREFFPNIQNREEAEGGFDRIRQDFEQNAYGWWVVQRKENPDFVGAVALVPVNFEAHFTPAMEIGWRFPVASCGNGYATEAAQALVLLGFTRLGYDEIVSMTARINLRSQRVMQRIGMTNVPADDFEHPNIAEGHPLRPHVLYRLRRPE